MLLLFISYVQQQSVLLFGVLVCVCICVLLYTAVQMFVYVSDSVPVTDITAFRTTPKLCHMKCTYYMI